MFIRVALIDDDANLRENFTAWLAEAEGLEVVGQFKDAESALKALPAARPDVVLMDIHLPGMDGIDCVAQLKQKMPKTQFVMLTMYENADLIFRALIAGATGYLLKRASEPELISAIKDAYNGGSPMTSSIARMVVKMVTQKNDPPAVQSLSEGLAERERQVIDLMARGYVNKEIADSLNISIETVKTYIRRIYEKLHVHGRAQAVAKYLGN